jgi:hypothetical protein
MTGDDETDDAERSPDADDPDGGSRPGGAGDTEGTDPSAAAAGDGDESTGDPDTAGGDDGRDDAESPDDSGTDSPDAERADGENGSPGDGDDGSPGDGGGGGDGGGSDDEDEDGEPAVDPERVAAMAKELVDTREALAATREELDELESRVDDKTVHRDDVTAELRRYVRARQRRGHATGWGPYLVMLYGTAMTLGAFYYLGGPWAVAAMLVIWLSTLGLYVFAFVVGATVAAGRTVGRLRDLASQFR